MEYVLMHRDIEVLECKILEEYGIIDEVIRVYNEQHVPIGIHIRNGGVDKRELQKWWKGRAIPQDREKLGILLEHQGIDNTEELLLINLGLSLTDHYWMKPISADLTWQQVNFYENVFADNLGEVSLIESAANSQTKFTPSFSLGGKLMKQWVIEHGRRILLKNGTFPYQQEPINEIFIAKLYDDAVHAAGCRCQGYSLRSSDKYGILSACECFTDNRLEFVPAYDILSSVKKSNSVSYLQHYKEVCKSCGCDVSGWMDTVLVMDYLVANTDRHLNNFGILRDSETLEWVAAAPVFDNGNSLWHKTDTELISNKGEIQINSFYETQRRQLEHVPSLPDIDFAALRKAVPVFELLLEHGKEHITEGRREKLCEKYGERIEELEMLYGEFAKRNRFYFPNKYRMDS